MAGLPMLNPASLDSKTTLDKVKEALGAFDANIPNFEAVFEKIRYQGAVPPFETRKLLDSVESGPLLGALVCRIVAAVGTKKSGQCGLSETVVSYITTVAKVATGATEASRSMSRVAAAYPEILYALRCQVQQSQASAWEPKDSVLCLMTDAPADVADTAQVDAMMANAKLVASGIGGTAAEDQDKRGLPAKRNLNMVMRAGLKGWNGLLLREICDQVTVQIGGETRQISESYTRTAGKSDQAVVKLVKKVIEEN